jgi:hypothetical protein
MGGMEQLVTFGLIFIAGILTASALYTIVYLAGRKANSDEFDERGFYGKKRR